MSSDHPRTIRNGVQNGDAPVEYPQTQSPDEPYRISPQYHSRRSKIRVASVGAGASGLCLAYKMEKMLQAGTWELTLFEKNDHLGGTWYENRYPGVACDIPSHLYTYTFDPNPDWSYFFAYGAEIQEYFERFAERYNSHRYMKLVTKVLEGKWNQEKAIWELTLEDQKSGKQWHDWAHVFINGTGILNNWKWPTIEGLHDFKGDLMHSAKWDPKVDFTGKTVGLIGTGSSSVQIVPRLQKVVEKMEVFMRSPTWVSPPFGAGVLEQDLTRGSEPQIGQRQYQFTQAEKDRFRNDPVYHLNFRKRIEAEINDLFGMYQRGSAMSNHFRAQITKEMNRRIGEGHDDLKKFIIPKWSPGCRRISPGDGYLEALVQSNVETVFTEITKVSKDGICTADGKLHRMDILVCATGFAAAFKPAFRVINGQGKTIDEDWSNGPNMYMGVLTPRFPNYFTIVGPGATWSNGTLLPSIETTIEYTIKCINKMQAEGIRSLAVKQDALDDLYAHFDEFHKNTVFSEECRSWFKDGKKDGRLYLWPGSTIHFLKSIKDPRFEDYDIHYHSRNRFAFLGNGEIKANLTNNVEGLSTYVRGSDHEWFVE